MKVCSVEGCDRTDCRQFNGGDLLCNRHYQQMYKYGEIRERTVRTPNDFIIEGIICKIGIYNKKGVFLGYALTDSTLEKSIRSLKWRNSNGYISSGVNNIMLHHLALGIRGNHNLHIDHINGNTWDNRKDNLRISTSSQNHCNVGKRIRNKSGYKGVTWDSSCNKWAVQIQKDYVKKWIGWFTTKEEAALAYNKAAIELHGEFAVLNVIKPILKRRMI